MKVVVSSWGCEYPQMPGVRTNAWSNVWPGIGTQVQGCTSPRRASCLSSSPRTWARLCEPGQPCPRSHERVNARISGVNAHLQWLACELHATPGTVVPNTHRLSRNTPISTFSPKRSAIWVPHHPEPRTHRPEPRPHRHQMGGIAPLGARHAGDTAKEGSKCCKPPPLPLASGSLADARPLTSTSAELASRGADKRRSVVVMTGVRGGAASRIWIGYDDVDRLRRCG